MISKMFAAFATLLLLLMAVGQASAQETGEIAFVFISESGSEYTYRLHGPESNFWIGSVHAGSTVVIKGPPGQYGYVLDGPPGVQYSGSIALLADGWADITFDDFNIAERADNLAPAAESTSTGTQTDTAKVVFISHTGSEYAFTLLGPDSTVWTGAVHRRASVVLEVLPGLYGYNLDGPGGNRFVGHVTVEAGGFADINFDDTGVSERVINPAPVVVETTVSTTPIFTYVVQPGDSLIKIAKKFNVDPDVLAASNGIVNTNLLTPGQVLLFEFDSYSVRSGDSLTRIARLFGVSLE